MSGDDDAPVMPQISAEERALQAQQSELLKLQTTSLQEQQQFQEDIQPFLFEELGIEETVDPTTGERTFARVDDPVRELRKDLELKQLQRMEDAFAGKLPVSPGLERELATTETGIRDRLRRQLGRNYESSTPGTEVLGDLFTRSAELREASRRGELTQGTQAAMSLGGFNQGLLRDFLGGTQNVAQGGLPFVQTGLGLSNALQGAQQPYFNQRAMGYQGDLARYQAGQQSMGQLFAGAGAFLGGAATGFGGYLGSGRIADALKAGVSPSGVAPLRRG